MARTKMATKPAAAAPALPHAEQVKAAKKKMADAIETFLIDICSFSEEAAAAIVDDQGYSDLDELCRMMRKTLTNQRS